MLRNLIAFVISFLLGQYLHHIYVAKSSAGNPLAYIPFLMALPYAVFAILPAKTRLDKKFAQNFFILGTTFAVVVLGLTMLLIFLMGIR